VELNWRPEKPERKPKEMRDELKERHGGEKGKPEASMRETQPADKGMGKCGDPKGLHERKSFIRYTAVR